MADRRVRRSLLCRGILSLSLAVVFWGCGGNAAPKAAASGKKPEQVGPLRVTATTGMIADTARAIGGEHVVVTGLMGPGVDPHLYKATQGDLEKLQSADLVLYNGLHLEGRMADVLVKLARTVKTVQVTETIPVERLREPPEFSGHYDPHVWFDVSLWKPVSERIRDALIEADPAHAAAYQRRAENYLSELDALDAYARAEIARIPPEHRVLVTAHDAFGYFGRAYGIEVLGLQGISTASEYGLRDVERLVETIVARKIRAVFVESSVSPRSIEALIAGAKARGHEVKIGGELYSDALGAADGPAGSYIGMVRHNVDTIVRGLL
jgi:manganese/zinc/iron transport system substrate-binding protein